MKIKPIHRLKDNPLFFKIFSCFLFLLIPTLIIGISTYIYSIQVIRKDFNRQISTNLQSAINTVDTYIQTAQEIGISFFDDETVQQLLLPSDSQTTETLVSLWKVPKLIQKDENIIGGFSDRVFVYNDQDLVYVSEGINQYDSFFNKFYRYQKYDTAFWAKELQSDKSLEILPPSEVKQSDSLQSRTVVPVVMTKQMNNCTAVMVQNISANSIMKTLDGNSVFKSTAYVVMDAQGNVIFDGGRFTATAQGGSWFKTAAAHLSQSNRCRLNGHNYIVTGLTSDLCGWRYYSLTPTREYNGQASNILLLVVLLCLMLIIMGVIFSYIFSMNIYSPIRNIRDIILQENLKIPEGNKKQKPDEIQTIREGISALSTSHARNETILNTYARNFIENTILLLVEGKPVDIRAFLKMLADYAGFDRKEYLCSIIQIEFNDNFEHDFQELERNEILNEIQKIIRSYFGDELKVIVLRTRSRFLCLANIDDEEQERKFSDNFARILKLFEYDVYYCGVTIGLSRRFGQIDDLGIAFDEVMTCIATHSARNHFEIISPADGPQAGSFCYSTADEQRILNCLSASDRDGLRAVIRGIWNKNKERRATYRQMNQLFQEMHFTGVRYLEENGVPREQIRLKDENAALFNDFGACMDVAQFESSLAEFYQTVTEIARNRAPSKQGELAGMIAEYIQENFRQNLSLEQIADEMNVSVKYVSRVFKEKTGTNLTAFINQVRVEKAKELLINTDLTVNEVADQIGIESRTTFLRVFKKIAGVAPHEYRVASRAKTRQEP